MCCFKCHLLAIESVQFTSQKLLGVNTQRGGKKKRDTMVSRYKVINSTLLAHIYLIAQLPVEKPCMLYKIIEGR